MTKNIDDMMSMPSWSNAGRVGQPNFECSISKEVYSGLSPYLEFFDIHQSCVEGITSLRPSGETLEVGNYLIAHTRSDGSVGHDILHLRNQTDDFSIMFAANFVKGFTSRTGLSCAQYKANHNGQNVSRLSDDFSAVLTGYVPGERPSPHHDLQSFGMQLAQFETAFDQLPRETYQAIIENSKATLESFSDGIAYLKDHFEEYEKIYGQEDAQTALRASAAFPNLFSDEQALDVCHADLHEGNLIVKPDNTLHYLDFEAMYLGGYRPVGFDFGQAAYRITLSETPFAKVSDKVSELKRSLDTLVDGYSQERGISHDVALGNVHRAAAAKCLQITRRFKAARQNGATDIAAYHVESIHKQAQYYRAVEQVLGLD